MKVKVEVEGRGFPLKIIIGYLLSSFSVGSIGKRGSLTIVLLLRRSVGSSVKFGGGGDTVVGIICPLPIDILICPIHVVTFTLISILVTDYIQKRRGQARHYNLRFVYFLPHFLV